MSSKPKFGLIHTRALSELRQAPENAHIYDAIATNTSEIRDRARSIKEFGVLEPIVISLDHVVMSGHRRYVAARLAGLKKVPVRVHPIKSDDLNFLRILVEYNAQRIKSAETLMREAVVKINPKEAHETLADERERKIYESAWGHDLQSIESDDDGRRREISRAKYPLLDAVIGVLNQQKDYWPLTVRQIHYRLLGPQAPLIHADKPDSVYRNDYSSYQKCVDICARGRVEDFAIDNIEAIKVALTIDQVRERNLPPSMQAKEGAGYKDFVANYGPNAYEFDALQPAQLIEILTDAINQVIDVDAYNQELEAEKADAVKIAAIREQANKFFEGLKLDGNG